MDGWRDHPLLELEVFTLPEFKSFAADLLSVIAQLPPLLANGCGKITLLQAAPAITEVITITNMAIHANHTQYQEWQRRATQTLQDMRVLLEQVVDREQL